MKHRTEINARGRRRVEWLVRIGWQPGLQLFGDPKAADWRTPDLRTREPDRASRALWPERLLDGAALQGVMTWRPE
ncbi:MAG: hypothetical protein AB9869_37300 [Verrucomicrobiia bacterium]